MAEPGRQERRRCGDLSEPAAWRPGLPRTEDLDWNEWALAHSFGPARIGNLLISEQTIEKRAGRPKANKPSKNEWPAQGCADISQYS